MKLTLAALALLCASCCAANVPSAQLPRHVQEKLLNVGSSARYGPHVLSYSRRPFGHPRRVPLDPPVASTPRAPEDYQLPTPVTPLSYHISLIPYLEAPPAPESPFTFDGEVTIRVRAREPTSTITMHAWDLAVSQIAVIRVRDGALVTVTNYMITTDDRNFFTIDVASALEAGQEYDIIVFYKGVLNSEGYGFFRSEWTDENGNQKWLAATQFESHAARRAFPCFDQPDMKAVFTMNIAQQPNYKALSNMPLASEGDPVEGLPGWTWARFQPSVPMSSYLVAFTTSEFMAVTNGMYSVWARPEVYLTGDYALQFSPQVVSYYEGFTGHMYSLPKMDQFSMTDFFSGAMENWGLITYQEPYVLHDPREDDASWKQLTTQVIAHEIAHQWFGDLVSPQWWSSLWLNEGFATYFEYHGVDGVNPDWQMREQFVVDNMHYSFRTDDGRSHPVYSATVDSPSSTDNIFDSITYSKGGCIVRFMVEFMGESNFKAGINEYLTAHAFGPVNQYDLFTALTPHAPANMPVTFTELMDSWTTQAGYPILTVQRNYFEQSVSIVQRRFGFNGPEQWIVPVTMTRGDAPNFTNQVAKAWLLPGDPFLYINSTLVPGSQDWFLINIAQTAFYRVNYDTGNWRLLTDALKADASVFHEVNRAQLMDDAHTFAIEGLLDYDSALRTTDYLEQETRFVPWEVATYALEYIRDRMYQDLARVQSFNSYMQQRILTVYNSVSGFNQQPTDSLGTMVTRRLITRWACNSRLAQCNTEGAALYNVWRASANPDTNNPIPLELRTPSYCAGHRANGVDARQFLLDRYAAATNSDERDRLISGMGCSDDTTLLQSYLDLSITTTFRAGDRLSVFSSVHSHPEGINVAYDFLLLNWREIEIYYGRVGYAFVSISDQLNTQDQYNRMVQFSADNAAELGPINVNLIDSAIATLASILTWNGNNLATVTNYFNNAQ